ncbi:hypothetical protein HMPREF9943_00295 [Eggerthia catenaformis OT 569 = DSM 20559]|uniref:Sensor histidine kinase NatK-like C-terminal domain-containing protein n=1 Tax=Eggerthia catenaformis OT 569 = DSM 20559 TaxID=999415 RepID=M2NH22_9FIRM|nr:GHKL domain-containing protein [Eggerthia catenaformis]EMD17508.1 hypothetical protein HMPREF9943_00295 [Eggerthia catenaformis OT 569 = DSM 20559]
MITIISSVTEQLMIILSILVISDTFFNQKFDIKKIKHIAIFFISLTLFLLLINKPVPVSFLNNISIFFIFLYLEGHLSVSFFKKFVFSYILIASVNLMMIILFSYLNIEIINNSFISTSSILSVLVFLLFLLLNLILNKIYKVRYTNRFLILLTLMSSLFLFYLIYSDNNSLFNTDNIINTFIYIFLFIIIIIFILFLYNKEYYQRLLEEKKKNDLLAYSTIQNQYIESIIKNNEDLRKFKHDYQSQMLTIQTLIKNNDNDALNDYLQKTTHHTIHYTKVSSNQYIDSIFNYFTDKYPQLNLSLSDDIIGYINIPVSELSSLFYNLISNACESALKTPQKIVSIHLKNMIHSFSITISNSIPEDFDLAPIKEKQTTKNDPIHHGIGLYIINDIISKYQGINRYHLENNTLINEIVLIDVIK